MCLSEMRHSYLRYPTSNCDTIYLYTLRRPYSDFPSLASFPTPNDLTLYSRVSYSECPTPYSRVSYSECPTPYECALLRIDTIRSPTPYKNPTPVGAARKAIKNETKNVNKNSIFCSIFVIFLIF